MEGSGWTYLHRGVREGLTKVPYKLRPEEREKCTPAPSLGRSIPGRGAPMHKGPEEEWNGMCVGTKSKRWFATQDLGGKGN